MRRQLNCVIGLAISMSFAGLASTAAAQTTNAVTPATSSANAALIKTLREAHHLLAHADKDYDGHRAKAAEAVHKALKDLGYHHKKAQSGTPPANGSVVSPKTTHAGYAKMHEPQANSDAQLKLALQLLQGVQFNGKHPKAAGHVQHAIREIDTALAIK